MSGLEVLIGVAGFIVSVLVVAAMILITPRGQVDFPEQASDQPRRSNGAAARSPRRGPSVPATPE